jgi:DMSO reductase family type II enzyme chaperone
MTTEQTIVLHSEEEMATGARSAIYKLLAGAFAFPSETLVESVAAGEFLRDMTSAGQHLPFAPPLDAGARAACADPSLTHDELQQEYIRVFEVGAVRPLCPLYEGAHRAGRMKIMEELVRFYEHFGLQPGPGDQPDHLCAELEFMHYLTFKEAAALSRSGPTEAFRLAQRDFLERHLCRWLPRLRQRLETLEPPPFYVALTRLSDAFAATDLTFLKGRRAKPDSDLVPLPD